MKKYIFAMGVVMMSLIVLSIKPTYGFSNNQLSINSNDLLNYIKEEKIYNIKMICTVDYCDYLKSTNMERAIEIFKTSYQQYLISKTNEEIALSTVIKGFPITKIETSN